MAIAGELQVNKLGRFSFKNLKGRNSENKNSEKTGTKSVKCHLCRSHFPIHNQDLKVSYLEQRSAKQGHLHAKNVMDHESSKGYVEQEKVWILSISKTWRTKRGKRLFMV